MFGFRKSPANNNTSKQKPANHYNSDTESDDKRNRKLGGRTSSEPVLITNNKQDYSDSEDLDSMSVQELESYAVKRSEDTTKSVNNCLRIAEDIRDDASRTLDTLHQQGDQIHRTHVMAADMDKDLAKGEKLLGNLGGMFSSTWKPKKTKKHITGPAITRDDNYVKQKATKAQREKLGLAPKGKPPSRTPPPEPTNAMQQVEFEKAKQDDALSDLSNILGDLKGMAVDMGGELDKQNKALDFLHDDVEELNSRVKGASQRARHLVGK